jgi:hypothetical protein
MQASKKTNTQKNESKNSNENKYTKPAAAFVACLVGEHGDDY